MNGKKDFGIRRKLIKKIVGVSDLERYFIKTRTALRTALIGGISGGVASGLVYGAFLSGEGLTNQELAILAGASAVFGVISGILWDLTNLEERMTGYNMDEFMRMRKELPK